MSLLSLKDIGKIYVSDGNVAVGIRGVNLSFERGEFVAVTGKSGSGKSTLLNVISGMDSYEEGELFVEGQPTSHYLQKEWEEYREKYISFIFQDYNIIESFTVLQNVELSLMHITDKKERRRRALELLDRVGMSSHIKQKGSKLSGGQKQRTVIARALAKDSPIILADEPTGNLDSATSAEIIELLKEVSKDKLLVVVTHNFEQLEKFATRHIRVFDGAIESDHIISHPEISEKISEKDSGKTVKKRKKNDISNGFVLGRTIFAAKPKLSLFICILMLVGTLGIFMVTTLCGEAAQIFEKSYMFNNIDGRVVMTTQNGKVLSEEEIKQIANKYKAKDYIRYDILLDSDEATYLYIEEAEKGISVDYVYGEDFGDDIIGKYPEKDNEIFLYVPIYMQQYFGENELIIDKVSLGGVNFKVTGVKYYYDNNLTAKCMLTKDGFRTATALFYLLQRSSLNMEVSVISDKSENIVIPIYSFSPSFEMENDKICINSSKYDMYKNDSTGVKVKFSAVYHNYNYDYYNTSEETKHFEAEFDKTYLTDKIPNDIENYSNAYEDTVYISANLVRKIAEDVLALSYRQTSLFFENNAEAKIAAEKLCNEGYIAVTADTTYNPSALEVISNLISGIMMAFLWVMAVVFLAFFISLCSSRTLSAFKGEMAIMRSMGISVKTIKVGMYVRMLLSLIPAFILVIVTAALIFTSPKLNEYFVYLYAWQYALIFAGMLLLTLRITRKQIQKLFGVSVKKAMKGGAEQ